MFRSRAVLLVLFLCGVAWLPMAAAQTDYPNRTVRMVLPAAPGGGLDFLARLLAKKMGDSTKQSFLVDNRPGAGGNIGLEMVAKATPDGYTLVLPTSAFPLNPSLFDKLPFDTINDFSPVVLMATAPLLLVVNPAVEAKTVAQLLALAKANPGKINYASGLANTANLAAELFKKSSGVDIVGIPYKGGGPAVVDLLGGRVQIYFSTIPAALQHIESGKLRGLAVTSTQRVSMLPNTPTVAESGLPGYEVISWFGMFAPAATPSPIIGKLNREASAALNQPDTRQQFEREGIVPGGGSPEALGQLLRSEITKWGTLIQQLGIKGNI
jgi:tripartite-type tricarboxylate transporter receptor subunit TctC